MRNKLDNRRNGTILIYGYHGQSNFGDELFVDVMKDLASQITRHRHPVFFRSDNVPTTGPERLWQRLAVRESRAAAPLRAVEFLQKALSTGRVAFCGGSLFSNFSGTHALTYLLVKARLCTVAAYGVSIGPRKESGWKQRLIDFLVASCDPLIVRDNESINRLEKTETGQRVYLGGDLAALSQRVRKPKSKPAREGNQAVVYIPCRTTNRTADMTNKLARSLPQNTEVVVLSVNSHVDIGDNELAAAIASTLASHGHRASSATYEDMGLDGVIEAIGKAPYVISERLHGALVAYLLEVPFAMCSYHAKCDDFAETIGLHADRHITPQAESQAWKRCVRSLTSNGGTGAEVPADRYRKTAETAYLSSSAKPTRII